MTYEHTEELYLHRNKSVAKSFYRQLKGEGFTHQQIIELSTTLLDLVTEDLRTKFGELTADFRYPSSHLLGAAADIIDPGMKPAAHPTGPRRRRPSRQPRLH